MRELMKLFTPPNSLFVTLSLAALMVLGTCRDGLTDDKQPARRLRVLSYNIRHGVGMVTQDVQLFQASVRDKSPHIDSRHRVGEILRDSGIPVVELRASMTAQQAPTWPSAGKSPTAGPWKSQVLA